MCLKCVAVFKHHDFFKYNYNNFLIIDYPQIETERYHEFKKKVVDEFSNKRFAGLPHVNSADDVRFVTVDA